MRIRYMSDLHLWPGFSKTVRPPRTAKGDVMVIAGDLAPDPELALDWLVRIRGPVVLVLGNHEFYHHDFHGAIEEYRKALACLPHVHLLERQEVVIDGIRFFGATMWTDFNLDAVAALAAEGGLNDFRYIDVGAENRHLRAFDVSARHYESLVWLERALTEGDPARTVVVTHHAPSALSQHQRWHGDNLSPAFCARLEELILDHGPALWFHGHLHESADYELGGTRILCNPFGYGWPGGEVNPEFDRDAAVEIGTATEDQA